MKDSIKINLDDTNKMQLIGKALSVHTRIEILKLLHEKDLNVNEIAEALGIPQSSSAAHVRVLEEAGIIKTLLSPGIRGTMKLCQLVYKNISIDIDTDANNLEKGIIIEMPIGHYVDYKVLPTCGLAGEKGPIGDEDEPRCFYHPDRTGARLLWLGKGYVEYRFPNDYLTGKKEKYIEISAEICSEDHEYNMDFPSDITVWVNDIEVGTWECPSDFGGRRGKFNPDWWPNKNTQYGMLKTFRIDSKGSYIDKVKTNENSIKEYKLYDKDYISVKIGIKEDAKHSGGMNLFGKNFGDYEQSIVLKTVFE